MSRRPRKKRQQSAPTSPPPADGPLGESLRALNERLHEQQVRTRLALAKHQKRRT